MKSTLIKSLLGLFLIALPFQTKAGGIPVIDVTHIAHSVQQLLQLQQQYARQYQELEEAIRQVEAVTGSRGVGDLFNGTIQREARRYTPGSWEDTLRILEAGGLPGSVADVRAYYDSLATQFPVLDANELNPLQPGAPVARAHERLRNTSYASMAVAEASYNQTETRMADYEGLMAQIDAGEDIKASSDLAARIGAENGMLLAELARLQSIVLQQNAAQMNQSLINTSNLSQMIQYNNFPINEIPTE